MFDIFFCIQIYSQQPAASISRNFLPLTENGMNKKRYIAVFMHSSVHSRSQSCRFFFSSTLIWFKVQLIIASIMMSFIWFNLVGWQPMILGDNYQNSVWSSVLQFLKTSSWNISLFSYDYDSNEDKHGWNVEKKLILTQTKRYSIRLHLFISVILFSNAIYAMNFWAWINEKGGEEANRLIFRMQYLMNIRGVDVMKSN